MNEKPAEGPLLKRSLSIEQWHQYGLQGDMLPVTITLEGESMRPLIRRGKEPVTILPLMRRPLIGDVVLFRGGPKRYVVHRVWKMRDGLVQTLGDNCVTPDAWMPLEDVWGLVVRFERFGRSWRLDTANARAFGRIWMALFPVRVFYKKCRGLAARIVKRVLKLGQKNESS